jgi:hypothetical protein
MPSNELPRGPPGQVQHQRVGITSESAYGDEVLVLEGDQSARPRRSCGRCTSGVTASGFSRREAESLGWQTSLCAVSYSGCAAAASAPASV